MFHRGALQMVRKHSQFQQQAIKNYYKNRDAISLQKVQEHLSELYLAEGKKRARYWKLVAGHLEKLGVPKSQIDHLVEQDNPAVVAQVIERLLSK